MKKLLLLSFIFAIFIRIDSVYAGDCGIPDLDSSIGGSSPGFISIDEGYSSNQSTYGLTSPGQWAVRFTYGVVYGMANCNSTNGGSYGTVNNNLTTGSSGKYCWCQVTGFTPTSNSYTSGPQCIVSPVSSSWVYTYPYGFAPICMSTCADVCSAEIGGASSSDDPSVPIALRAALFGAVPRAVTIGLTWDGSSSTTPTSCTLGSTFVPPTPEPRPGYIFTGWKVKTVNP